MNESFKNTTQTLPLRSLQDVRPLYLLPNDCLADEVLVPGFHSATNVDCMVGFFSSQVLAELAPGLATYINCSKNPFRIIISPILSEDDQKAIEISLEKAEVVAADFFEELLITEDVIQQHTLKCFSWMLAKGRIEIKIALMKNGLFHPKIWLFQHGMDVVAAYGSSNGTFAGIRKNYEQISVSKSWESDNQRFITEKFGAQFVQLWENRDENCLVIPIPDAVRKRVLQAFPSRTPPTESDLKALYNRVSEQIEPLEDDLVVSLPAMAFSIPKWIQYEDGPFQHQGLAVNAWREAGCRGVLEMATGSGKTISAMICAYRLYQKTKPLLIVVAAPYVPLIQQWCDEISQFGLRPVNLSAVNGARGRAQQLNRIKRRFRHSTSDVEAVVVSHRTLCSESFKSEISQFDYATLLIADEVHNLGSVGFIADPPHFFEHRLGLSATPVRQYDDEGTDALFDFFGPVVFQFTLKEAIGQCLVEYDYYVHPVELTMREMDDWKDLTAEIKKNAWRQEQGKPDDHLTKLFRDRRVLLETAQNKIEALAAALGHENLQELKYALIYASDKAPQQLEAVNALLNSRGVLFHQLTQTETKNREETARIIRSYQEGTLRLLTAKRVLDEGVNIPQIQKAFILASTTVERQWVQRRGRVLRKCSETGKTYSEIHDFLALPSDLENLDDDARTLIRSELLRAQEFASLARNAGRENGPLETIHKLVLAAFL